MDAQVVAAYVGVALTVHFLAEPGVTGVDVNKRYLAGKSPIVTSNKSYGQWGEIFPAPALAVALLDRQQQNGFLAYQTFVTTPSPTALPAFYGGVRAGSRPKSWKVLVSLPYLLPCHKCRKNWGKSWYPFPPDLTRGRGWLMIVNGMAKTVDNWTALLEGMEERLLAGGALSLADAKQLMELPDEHLPGLLSAADRIREYFTSDQADLCSIINARSGKCREDCKFCVQSNHYRTDSPVYPLKPAGEIIHAAQRAEQAGAHRFCIVTSGEALGGQDFQTVLDVIGLIAAETGLKRCASLGRLTGERVERLREAGLNRYHHNVETARSYFPSVCTTHTYEDKLKTILLLKEAGIETCVGGILNLGESPGQRLELAFELKELEPDSVPVNFLVPQPGTPLAGRKPIPALEAARCLAIFRLVMPQTHIRLAGGRVETFGDKPGLPFQSGANALLIGSLLTMPGPDVKSDITLLTCLGFDVQGGKERHD